MTAHKFLNVLEFVPTARIWSCSWSSTINTFYFFLWLSRFLKFSRAREVSADNMVPWIEEYPVCTFGLFFLLVNPVQQKYSLIFKLFHILLSRFHGIFSCGFVCGSHPFQGYSAVYRVEEVSSVDSHGSYNFFGQTIGQTNYRVHQQMVPNKVRVVLHDAVVGNPPIVPLIRGC